MSSALIITLSGLILFLELTMKKIRSRKMYIIDMPSAITWAIVIIISEIFSEINNFTLINGETQLIPVSNDCLQFSWRDHHVFEE
jgi:hypothetical protein